MAAAQMVTTEVNEEALKDLLNLAREHHYSTREPYKNEEQILSVCQNLFEKDYECYMIKNFGESLKTWYPRCLILPLKDKNNDKASSIGESFLESDERKFRQRCEESTLVRQYNRVVVPAILFNGNYICRAGAVYENAVPAFGEEKLKKIFSSPEFEYQMNLDTAVFLFVNAMFAKGIETDVELLKYLKVEYLCDLRLNKKFREPPKYPDIVDFTEGQFKKMYKEFAIAHIPYPGVNSFEKYSTRPEPERLFFNFRKVPGLFDIELPDIDHKTILSKDIRTFKTLFDYVPHQAFPNDFFKLVQFHPHDTEWSLYDLTYEYLLVLLTYITFEKGILVHCVLGVDRTPVFITLIRLSLWADGLIHQSLSAEEVLYLCIAYDWYFFGHNLPATSAKNLLIMRFCFDFLNRISTRKLSLRKSDTETTTTESGSSSTSAETIREKKLKQVRELFLEIYD